MGKSTVLPYKQVTSPEIVVGVGRVAQWAVASGTVHAQRIDWDAAGRHLSLLTKEGGGSLWLVV